MQLYMPNYNPQIIGKNLRRLRTEKGLSVEYVREYLHLGSVQSVYQYETGVKYPRSDTLLALMQLYDADVYDIIGKEGGVKSPSLFLCFYFFLLVLPARNAGIVV